MKEIILNSVKSTSKHYKKFVALVDDKDFEKVNKYKWTIKIGRGVIAYAFSRRMGSYQSMHQFIMNDKMIDHINYDGLDNRKSNLRKVTKQQNNFNKRPAKHSSKFKGVYFFKRTGRWHSQIALNQKKIHIGFYTDEKEAAKAYNKKAIELYGEFAYINQV